MDAAKIANDLIESELFYELQRLVLKEVDNPIVNVADIKNYVGGYIRDSGLCTLIGNFVYDTQRRGALKWHHSSELNNTSITDPKAIREPSSYLLKAQVTWERCIVKSINSMCSELAVPLSRKRSTKDQAEFASKFSTFCLGAEYNNKAYQKLRPVYSSADFYEVLVGVKNLNLQSAQKDILCPHWSFVRVQLHTPDFADVRRTYSLMSKCHFQTGIDDRMEGRKESSVSDWYRLGQKVISLKHCGAAQQYCKQGCPAGLRRPLWLSMFYLNITDKEKLYFEQLKESVVEYDMLVDHLIMKDVQLTTTNDDAFFVFEDLLYQILLVMSRDTQILDHFQYSSASPAKCYIRGKLGVNECCVNYPPSGIIPFHGFAMFAAPLCYVYDDPAELYFVFRHIYIRHFFRLHCISSDPHGILSLCILFERLLQAAEPALFWHLLDIGAQPVHLVFNWLLFAFSGYLSADETLLLWDRIFGYNSLQLLAVTAVAIMSYRRENLLSVDAALAAEAVLADITTLRVMPVLVSFLSDRRF